MNRVRIMSQRYMPAQPLIAIVDDDPAGRDSLAALLSASDYSVLTYESGEALLAAGVPGGASCLVVDVCLGLGQDGIALVETLRRAGDRTPTVVATAHGDIALAVRAMRAGAIDFVEKPYMAQRMLDAVAEARRTGEAEARARSMSERLTAREREVLAALASGKANKVIAGNLGISVRTVETYRASIMAKLEARSLADLVRIALSAGIEA